MLTNALVQELAFFQTQPRSPDSSFFFRHNPTLSHVYCKLQKGLARRQNRASPLAILLCSGDISYLLSAANFDTWDEERRNCLQGTS